MPLGAVLGDGRKPVFVLMAPRQPYAFGQSNSFGLSDETAVISGLSSGDPIVSLALTSSRKARVRIA